MTQADRQREDRRREPQLQQERDAALAEVERLKQDAEIATAAFYASDAENCELSDEVERLRELLTDVAKELKWSAGCSDPVVREDAKRLLRRIEAELKEEGHAESDGPGAGGGQGVSAASPDQ